MVTGDEAVWVAERLWQGEDVTKKNRVRSGTEYIRRVLCKAVGEKKTIK